MPNNRKSPPSATLASLRGLWGLCFGKLLVSLSSVFPKYRYLNYCFYRIVLLFASRCATLAWSRGLHNSRDEKALALERTPEAGRSFELTAWCSRCLRLYFWNTCAMKPAVVVDIYQMFILVLWIRSLGEKGRREEKMRNIFFFPSLSLF